MARFDVYTNPSGQGFVLDVQADVLSGLNTRIVVPLLQKADAPTPLSRLNPIFGIADKPHVMLTQFMAAIPASLISSPVTNLAARDTDIMAALDMVLVGF